MAIFYDLILMTAILLVAGIIAFIINGGEQIDRTSPFHTLYVIYLATICFSYYTWFWTHGGQTLGMKTWRMQLHRQDGINLMVATAYFFSAILSWLLAGLGFLMALFHPENKTLHDILNRCEMRDLR